MVVHSIGVTVGVSISSPLKLGLDSQVSGLTSCGPLPIVMRKSSSEATRMTCSDAIICINFPIIAINYCAFLSSWQGGPTSISAVNLHCRLSLHDDSKGPGQHQAHVNCTRAALTVSIWTQSIQLLPIIAIIWTIIVINLKRRIALVGYSMFKTAAAPGPTSNHSSSPTTNSPCPSAGPCWTASAE